MACFVDINVSQGSVATYAGCGRMFNIHLTANLLKNLPVKKIVNRLRFDRKGGFMVMSLWPTLFCPSGDLSKQLLHVSCIFSVS